MKGQIITIWGLRGKTTAAANLAWSIAEQGKLVCIVSSNRNYGKIQGFWGQTIQTDKSIIRAFEDDIEVESLLWKAGSHGTRHNIFLLTLPNEFDVATYPDISISAVEDLMQKLMSLFSVVVVIGSADMQNPLSSIALTLSHKIVLLHTPGVASLQWFRATERVRELWFLNRIIKHIINAPDNSISVTDYCQAAKIKVDLELPLLKDALKYENSGSLICENETAISRPYIKAMQKLAELL